MQVKEVMNRKIDVIGPDTTLDEAAEKMQALKVGVLPVCDGDRLVVLTREKRLAGILSLGDLAGRYGDPGRSVAG